MFLTFYSFLVTVFIIIVAIFNICVTVVDDMLNKCTTLFEESIEKLIDSTFTSHL